MPSRGLLLLSTCLAAISLSAQVTQLSDATAPPVHGVGHNYEGMLNETVNPSTGALTIHNTSEYRSRRAVS
jgi:hypothetical protein